MASGGGAPELDRVLPPEDPSILLAPRLIRSPPSRSPMPSLWRPPRRMSRRRSGSASCATSSCCRRTPPDRRGSRCNWPPARSGGGSWGSGGWKTHTYSASITSSVSSINGPHESIPPFCVDGQLFVEIACGHQVTANPSRAAHWDSPWAAVSPRPLCASSHTPLSSARRDRAVLVATVFSFSS